MTDIKYVSFHKKLWMVGFGCIASGTVPLIFRHIDIKPEQIEAFASLPDQTGVAEKYGIKLNIISLTPENYESILDLQPGDFLLNLSTDVGSLDLIKHCNKKGALYLDTCVEPWPGGYFSGSISSRSNYALRETVVELKKEYQNDGNQHPTLISCFGANPGLVSCFVKQAMLNISRDTGFECEKPTNRREWAELSKNLGVKVIHIAEIDTQITNIPKKRLEFVNTWSCYGFISEGCQPSELGWGTHEKDLPEDGHRHDFGCDSAIYLDRPGVLTKVRTWTPSEGNFHGFLITHNESISISDYYTVKDEENSLTLYRPTVHYAYHPCNAAVISLHELAGKNFDFEQLKLRLLMDDITDGMDELGVLLCGHAKNAYWFGSQLTIQQAREVAPFTSATSLQVCVAVLSGMIIALENPNQGILEADDLDFERVLEISKPYLGDVIGEYTDWNPLKCRPDIGYPDIVDLDDCWQFKNVRVY